MKKYKIILILFFFSFFIFTSIAISVPISNGSFGGSLEVQESPAPDTVTLSSGTFGGQLKIEYYVFSNWSGWWSMLYAPSSFDKPTDMASTSYSSSQINLTWTNNTYGYTVYIVRNESGYSTTRDRTPIYNDTDNESFEDTSLLAGTHCYYTAWSWNDTLNAFSENYSTTDNWTRPGDTVDLHSTGETMTSITLAWTKGTNTTKTVIVMNETGYNNYPTTPTNGTVIYNSTGSSYQKTGLTANTTYYFTAWSYLSQKGGLWSTGYDNTNESTPASADTPTSFTASTVNSSIISLTWTKPNPDHYTYIERNTISSWTRGTGTFVYNGTASNKNDNTVNAATHYYYRAWSWNGAEYSIGYASANNRTWPDPPVNLIGNIDDTTLTITWVKGTGATHTHIRKNTSAYPEVVANGTFVYNGTGTEKVELGVTSINYYRAWSWAEVDGISLFSEYTNLLFGGIEINAYKSTNISISINNYTVFIKNQDGSQTYINSSANNPCRIDLDDLPLGDDIIIQVSKDGYKTVTQTWDLAANQWYALNFYLPPDIGGGGDDGEDDYIPPDDENESYASQYLFKVFGPVGDYGADIPINGAKINIKQYIASSGVYEPFYIVITDANGQATVNLIPGELYQITISKTGYDTEVTSIEPREIVNPGDYIYTFRLIPSAPDIPGIDYFWDDISFTGVLYESNNSLKICYSDINSSTVNTHIYVYQMYNGSFIFNDSDFRTGSNNFCFWMTNVNINRSYRAVLFFNTTASYNVEIPVNITIYRLYPDNGTGSFDERMDSIFGDFKIGGFTIGWHSIISVIIAIIVLLAVSPFDVGMGIIGCGLSIGLMEVVFSMVNNSISSLIGLAPVIVGIGILYYLVKGRAEDHL